MKLLIADDEPLARERLKSLVADINSSIEVAQASNGLEVLQQVSDFNPDIILLDIRMPEMDGIEAAQHLSTLENPPAIIFTTAYDQYTFEALDAQAIAYLLKPIRQELLEKALQRCQKLNKLQLQSLLQEDSYRAHISTKLVGNIQLIPIEDIFYFQADHKYVVIKYLKDNQIKEAITEESLKSLELEFQSLFVRIHRNTLVQIKLIEALVKKDSTLFLKLKGCDDLIEISRRHHASIRQLIG
jgi:two-component system, LytTR family, response regulator AlgR